MVHPLQHRTSTFIAGLQAANAIRNREVRLKWSLVITIFLIGLFVDPRDDSAVSVSAGNLLAGAQVGVALLYGRNRFVA